MASTFLLGLFALCSPLALAELPASSMEAVAAAELPSRSSSLELLQRTAVSLTKVSSSSEIVSPKPEVPRRALVTHYNDSDCTIKEGSSMNVSAETDECLLGWNYTCGCSPSGEKLVIGHHMKHGCNDPRVHHVREIPVGRCMEGRYSDSDADVYMKVDDFGTCPCCGSKCSAYGDPHITVFDQAEVSLLNIKGLDNENDVFGYGDYWLVKSDFVHVQGRYRKVVYPKARFQEHSFLTGVAIGGPFLQGNILLIGPRDTGKIEVVNEAGDLSEILKEGYGMYKDALGDLIEIHYQAEARMIKDRHQTAPGLYIHLPNGVKVELNRYGKHLDFSITMTKDAAGPGPVDGQCGNFNGNPADDSAGLIAARMGYKIPKDELLFMDEGDDEEDTEELVASPGSLSDGLSVLEEASSQDLMESEGTPLKVYLYADSECQDPANKSFIALEAGPTLCEFGWNFTCSCDGTAKVVIAEQHWPSCGAASFAPDGEISAFMVPANECLPPIPPHLIGNVSVPAGVALATTFWRLDASACPCCEEPAQCTLHGDPHITVFDQAESSVLALLTIEPQATETNEDQPADSDSADMYGWGDFWLVKSERVWIQARYRKVFYPKALEPLNHTYLTSVAVGGPFMRGHKVIVEPRDGVITWSFGETHQAIFNDGEEDSSFEMEEVVKGRYHNRTSLVPGPKPVVPGVDLELPAGVKVLVDRFGKHLDLQISMTKSAGGPGGIDGQCGNYNGDASDDTAELINGRIGYQVPASDSLFERNPLDMQA